MSSSTTFFFDMDPWLYDTLKRNGISDSTLSVLLEEDVTTSDTFNSLEREHFDRLAQKLTVGQHAIVLKTWKRQRGKLIKNLQCNHALNLLYMHVCSRG